MKRTPLQRAEEQCRLQGWPLTLAPKILAAKSKYPTVKVRKYRLWTYDVWGNARDGFEVNDRSLHGYVTIKCKLEVFNAGTEHEFATHEPTDRQLSRAAGFSRVSWDGMEGLYYAEQISNGRPIGELNEEERPEFVRIIPAA